MKYDAVIFDLDGTLWDALEVSAEAWTKGFKDNNIQKTVTADDLRSVVGKPFIECLERISPDIAKVCPGINESIDYHEKRVIDEFGGKIYDGAAEIISELSAVTQVFIVSNCDDWYLEAFFRHSELQRYMAGYDCFGMSRVSKSLMLKNMTGVNNLVNPVYIGDTHSDFEAAQEANADFIFAEYGFGVLDQECMRIKNRLI